MVILPRVCCHCRKLEAVVRALDGSRWCERCWRQFERRSGLKAGDAIRDWLKIQDGKA